MSTFTPPNTRSDAAALALAGKIVLPEHGRFEQARLAWNLAVEQRPAAVALPDTPQGVVAAVRFAREQGLQVAPQGTGHNAAPLGELGHTVLLKTERMRSVRIDPEARLACVEAGTLWLEVVQAAARHGLAALAGSSPDVGVVGYTLGGGMSWLGRKHGLAANSVHAIELVTADGSIVRADRSNETELFWALRGGGGSFGVVTAIELELFPITEVHAGILWFPLERGSEVLNAWRELTAGGLPDELSTVGRFLSLPPLPEVPEPVRGKSFVIVEAIHLGEPAQADELLAPLRELGPVNDTVGPMPVEELSHLHMDPEQPVPGVGDGATLAALPEEAIEALVQVAGAGSGSPLLSVEIRHLGGEYARPRPENGALAAIEADYLLHAVGITPTEEAKEIVAEHVERVLGSVEPWTARHTYLNFAETGREQGAFWSEQAHRRLCQVKSAFDPQQLLRSNHPIVPVD
jgi:FAD binding domain-containing protein